MPRNPERKTARGLADISFYQNAYNEVKSGSTFRSAAKKYGINHVSLRRYSKKREANGSDSEINVDMGYKAHNKVFSDDQELELSGYLMSLTDIYIGVSAKVFRRIIYEWAAMNQATTPKIWIQRRMAGEEWFRSFIKRHPELSSQWKGMFERVSPNVTLLENLERIMKLYQFRAQDIYNVMEIGITTNQKLDRVVTRNNSEEIKTQSRAEKGTLVTAAFTANAVGDTVSPLFVFPDVWGQKYVIKDGPIGSIGITQPSGWIQEKSLLVLLNHFKSHRKASASNKMLLIIDRLSSQVNIQALNFCRENGVVLLSTPLYFSQKLLPLRSSVFAPLRKGINKACVTWVGNHPAKNMSVHDIPSIVAAVMPLAFTEENICNGFRKTGFYPLDACCFTELMGSKPKPERAVMKSSSNFTPDDAIFPSSFSLSEEPSLDGVLSISHLDVPVNAPRSETDTTDVKIEIEEMKFLEQTHAPTANVSPYTDLETIVKTEPGIEDVPMPELESVVSYDGISEDQDAKEDACTFFGKYVAAELRSLPLKHRIQVQQEIQNCITSAVLRNISTSGDSDSTIVPNVSSSAYSPHAQ